MGGLRPKRRAALLRGRSGLRGAVVLRELADEEGRPG